LDKLGKEALLRDAILFRVKGNTPNAIFLVYLVYHHHGFPFFQLNSFLAY
jgi:hypothetical protein